MITEGNKCDKCSSIMILDRVTDGKKFYVCINPQCSEYKKAYSKDGEESKSTIRERSE